MRAVVPKILAALFPRRCPVCGEFTDSASPRLCGQCAEALAGALFEAKGLDAAAVKAVDMKAYKEEQYDKLAQAIRENMDMELVYRVLNRKG